MMPRNENQLNKAIAILQLLLSQTDNEHVLKTLDISELLYDAFDIEAGERAVLRDLNQLRDMLENPAPIEDIPAEHAEDIP